MKPIRKEIAFTGGEANPIAEIGVAKHHIVTAIQLISINASTYTTHMVVMAADEVTGRLMKANGISDKMNLRERIKDEYKDSYTDAHRQYYNYLKHLGKGRGRGYPWPSEINISELNSLILALCIYRYGSIAGRPEDVMNMYQNMFIAKYNDLVLPIFWEENPQFLKTIEGIDITDDLFADVIRQGLFDNGLIPQVPPDRKAIRRTKGSK